MLKRYLRVLGRTIRVESDNRALLDAVEERYAPYLISMREADACGNGDVGVLELAESDQGLRVGFGGRQILLEGGQSWLKPDDVVIYVLRKLLPNLAFVHASTIQEKGRAALFVGSTHQGKTTLAYALARNGFAPMSDDLAPLDLGSGRVFSLYTAATVRPQTAAIAAQHGWSLPHACASSGENVAEFSAELAFVFCLGGDFRPSTPMPAGASIQAREESAILGALEHLFFQSDSLNLPPSTVRRPPKPDFQHSPVLKECSCAFGTKFLLNRMYHPQQPLGGVVVQGARLISRVRTFVLVPGKLQETVDLVTKVLRGGPSDVEVCL